ncbi:MAG: bifunctional nuclease family protein [Sulfolobaceae archaeon]
MKGFENDEYIKVEKVEAFFYPINSVPVIVCYLEDGRQFYLFHVPPEIVISINRILGVRGYEEMQEGNKRDSIYEILETISEIKEIINKRIEKVIVNDIIREYGVYVATVELKFDGIIIERRMIPSHAIYLAILGERPIFIKKELVDEQERESREVRR